MKWIQGVLLLIIAIIPLQSLSQGLPLRVGVEPFEPPFILQAANKQLYGFDINVINSICRRIDRTCQFTIMSFDRLLSAVRNNQLDVAISAITITVPRAKLVNFSLPYFPSSSRFLTRKEFSSKPFSLLAFKNKKIGIERGTVFKTQMTVMGIKNPNIIEYQSVHLLIDALNNKEVDFVLLDNPSSLYWAAQSSGALKTFGRSLNYGFGYAVAINKQNQLLLGQINKALLDYQKSDEFKKNYRQYLEHIAN